MQTKNDMVASNVDSEPREDFIPEAGKDFVITPYIQDLTDRALAYIRVGYAVHLSGPAGTGKSTLAMHIAAQLGQPCALLHGDDEFRASDLLGRDTGYQKSSTVDNYISSIVKTEESVSVVWTSNRLTTACQKGHTLIYDEFTRSPATANNPFLSILEEGILNIPSSGRQKGYIKVHPSFRAIFTSNPEEYVGVHKTQDALLDRMITIELEYADEATEIAIVEAKSGRSNEDASRIVRLVRKVRQALGGKHGPTVRAAIAIARILNERETPVDFQNPIFCTTCKDVLNFHVSRSGGNSTQPSGQPRVDLDSIISGLDDEPIKLTKLETLSSRASDAAPPRQLDDRRDEHGQETALLKAARDLSDVVSSPASTQTIDPRSMAPSTTEREFPKPPAEVSPPGTTASPHQMLEAAVTRFARPPKTATSQHASTPSSIS